MIDETHEQDIIVALVTAIETIQANWQTGDLAQAVRDAVALKDEVCQQYGIKLESVQS